MAVLVTASTSCDNSELVKSIAALADKIDMLINLTQTFVDPIPPIKDVAKDSCSCENNTQAIGCSLFYRQ